VTRSRDAQGFGLAADAPRYLHTLLRRPLGALALIPTAHARFTPGGGTATPQRHISQKTSAGSAVCSDIWKEYNGITFRRYVHRLVNYSEKLYSDRRGNHINGLEGFKGYLKRELVSKGGIHRKKLPLYLEEYV